MKRVGAALCIIYEGGSKNKFLTLNLLIIGPCSRKKKQEASPTVVIELLSQSRFCESLPMFGYFPNLPRIPHLVAAIDNS